MAIIDAHVHVLPHFPPLAPFEDSGRVDRLLWWMDDAGVDRAIMLPVVADFAPDNNAECAAWARQHPDRLTALTNVALDADDAATHVARARDRYGAAGISYYPRTADMAWMLEPARDSLWAAFAAADLVCNLQVDPPNYGVIVELAGRHPSVRFVCNHLGLPGKHFEPEEATYGGLLAARQRPNLFVKASAFYASATTAWDLRCPRGLGYLHALVRGLGADRVLFGTDWPPAGRFLTYRQAVEVVRSAAALTDEQRDLVLGDNAARVYRV